MLSHKLRMIGGGYPNGYWTIEYTAGMNLVPLSVAVDDEGDVYMAHNNSNTTTLGLVKATSRGTPLWSKTFAVTANTGIPNEIIPHPSGGIAGAGDWREPSNSVGMLSFRVDADGGKTWAKDISQTTINSFNGYGCTVDDTTGDIYTVGETSALSGGTGSASLIYRRNSSGVIQRWWQLDDATGYMQAYSCDYQQGGTIKFVVGSKGPTGCHLTVFDNNALATNYSKYTSGGVSHTVNEVKWDGSNIYSLVDGADVTLMKTTNTLGITWQRKVNTSATAVGMDIDSSGNIFVTTYKSNTLYISKYNSSGTYQDGHTLTLSGTIKDTPRKHSFRLDGDDNMIICLGDNTGSGWLMRLPSDGSEIGTFGDLTIASATVGDAAGALSPTTSVSSGVSTSTSLDGSASGGATVDYTTSPVFTGIS